MSADGPLPAEFTVDLLAEAFHCRPSAVREEDEIDIALRLMRLRVKQQVAAEQAYFER